MKNISFNITSFFCFFYILSCSSEVSSDENKIEETQTVYSSTNVLEAIQSLDSLKLRYAIGEASTSESAFDILSNKQQILYFVENRETLPILREHFFKKKASLTNEDRIKYFTVFGVAKDSQMVTTIVEYVELNKDKPRGELDYKDHPFYYSIKSLQLITGIKIDEYSFSYALEADTLLKKVRIWQNDIILDKY